MVIRRLRQHATTHDWFAVAIDILIVVIGVFLGLQANNWNSARIAASDAIDHRARLIEDVAANEQDMAARLDYYSAARRHALMALAALETGRADGEVLLVDLYQASQINSRTLRRSTYDELIAAGDLSQVGDSDLRDVAETYYRGLKVIDDSVTDLPAYRDRIRRELPYQVIARIRERCGDVVSERNGVVMFKLPEQCRLDLPPALIATAVARVRSAPGLDRDLSRYIVDLDTRIGNLKGSQDRAVRFDQVLRSANTGTAN